jgi:hypothetical protein
MFALAFVFTAVAAPPQRPDEVLATYQLDGKPATVTRTDVALEMAFHLRRRERGQEAVQQLVDTTITRARANEKHLMPQPEDARTFWRELQEQFRAAGRRPEDFAAVRNMSEAELLDYLAVQLAQERVVRAELGLPAKEKVGGDMLRLWLQEERKKTTVISDADLLPPGTAVRVGTTEVPLIELGLLLLRTAEEEEREYFVRQVAYCSALEAIARREGIEVTSADLDAAVQKRRDEARDPRYRGITFENLLKSQGLTIASLRDLRVFRAKILLDKLARRRFPDSELAAEIAKDRQVVLDRVGARRHISIVFSRALAQPNALVPRDFAAAKKHLEGVRERLQKESFENVARIESDHAKSKMQGGDTGWHWRRSDQLPEPVLAAAFSLATGELSAPVQAEDGCYLVKVAEVEPEPSDEVLLQRLRECKASELQQQLVADAKIELAKGAKK